MKIKEQGKNMEITDKIKDYLYKKLEHLDKFLNQNDESILCEVELGKTTRHHQTGNIFRTEINLHIAGKNLRAVSEMDDLFASIDLAKDEMARQLEENKDKRISLLRRGGVKIKNLIKGIFNSQE
jgi:putative sigma-54 modulation protein